MNSPANRFALSRIEWLTLLLIGAIAFAVILPRFRPHPADGTTPAQQPPKHAASVP